MRVKDICRQGPVIPVMAIDSLDQAAPSMGRLAQRRSAHQVLSYRALRRRFD